MLHLSDGRDHGYMWDTGRKLKCDAGLRDGTTVFFMLPGRYDPIPMAVENSTVPVPDEAWHKEGKFIVFLYAMDSTGRYTRTSRTFTVKYAPKPNNYAYTPTEVLDWHTLEKRLEDLEGEGLANAVAEYLKENPVEAGATAEEAAQIEQNKTNIATLDRTKLAASELPNAVNEALAQAKASGVFDGEDGKDYVLTEADKQEIAQEAAGMVEVPSVDIPTTLPNPNALTFTGAATGTYDGSTPLTVNIPEGGGGTGGGSAEWELLATATFTPTDKQLTIDCASYGKTEFFIVGETPKTANESGFNIGIADGPTLASPYKTNVYPFDVVMYMNAVDGQISGFAGMVHGWAGVGNIMTLATSPRFADSKKLNFSFYPYVAGDELATIRIYGR